jgi:hypothetical protein
VRVCAHARLVHQQRQLGVRSPPVRGPPGVRPAARHPDVGAASETDPPVPLRRADLSVHHDVPHNGARLAARAAQHPHLHHQRGHVQEGGPGDDGARQTPRTRHRTEQDTSKAVQVEGRPGGGRRNEIGFRTDGDEVGTAHIRDAGAAAQSVESRVRW